MCYSNAIGSFRPTRIFFVSIRVKEPEQARFDFEVVSHLQGRIHYKANLSVGNGVLKAAVKKIAHDPQLFQAYRLMLYAISIGRCIDPADFAWQAASSAGLRGITLRCRGKGSTHLQRIRSRHYLFCSADPETHSFVSRAPCID